MRKYSWKMLFNDFKKNSPDKWRRGTGYGPCEFMSIFVYIPEDGKYKYEYFGKKLTLVERYLTTNQVKVAKQIERGKEIKSIFEKMNEKGISQTSISHLSGVSRMSLNKYKNGRLVPKASTLEKIKKALEMFD